MSSSRLSARHRWFLILTLVAVLVAIAVGTVLWQSVQLSSLGTASTRVDAVKPWATAARVSAIAVLAMVWPWFSPDGGLSAVDDATRRAQWITLRWRVIGWLLVIELLLGQGLFGRFVALLAGTP